MVRTYGPRIGTLGRACYLRSSLAIRECFPSATIGVLKATGRDGDLRTILSRPGTVVAEELEVVLDWLDGGVSKKTDTLYDRADALVASLSGIAFAGLGFGEKELDRISAVAWEAGCRDASEIEGRIAVLT